MSGERYDWVVIGSGFGGSVSALRLAEKGYRVLILEQGRRFSDEELPASAWQSRDYLWNPRLGQRGILQRTRFAHVTVINGVGVGGGSLVYANTLYRPHDDAFFRHPQWAGLADWRHELDPHYAVAEQMLGVTAYAGDGPSERLMRGLAEDLGVPDAYRTTPVGVFFGAPGETVADPYFDGRGPARTGCTRCGQCMLGCRVGAKNTLPKNYLWLAERLGAEIVAERTVTEVRPVGAADGSDGYVVRTERSGALARKDPREVVADGVVVAAGTLGTNLLLRRCKDSGALPRLSDRLGQLVRTNSEAITAATAADPDADFGRGVAISASVFPDAHTHFTNNTFGAGGDALALTYGPLTAGSDRARRRRQLLGAIVRHPLRTTRRWWPRGWSRRSVMFTVMQSTETALRLVPRRRGLQTEQDGEHPVDTYLPIANRVAELAARRMGGWPQSALAESWHGTPTSAHFLGGAVIGADPATGVVDRHRRAFGYRNLLVCDGASVPANVGVNPSLTITAMAEEAMSHVPAKPGAVRAPDHRPVAASTP